MSRNIKYHTNILEKIDMTGTICKICKTGSYKETSIHDDIDGKLHCYVCGHEIDRYNVPNTNN